MTDSLRDQALACVVDEHNCTVTRRYTDATGTIGYRMFHPQRGHCILVVKQYAYAGKASVIKRLLKRALGNDDWLAFYSAADDTAWLFDARTVANESTPSRGASKTRDNVHWVELPLDYGIPLSTATTTTPPTPTEVTQADTENTDTADGTMSLNDYE